MKNTLTIKVTKTTTEDMEVSFPIYATDGVTICAIYSNNCVYRACDNEIEKSYSEPKFWLGLLKTITTKEKFLDVCKRAKLHQERLFTDIVWRESMEQNPAMSDMTIKDYSPERLEEMNYDVRDADEAERMELNAEIED